MFASDGPVKTNSLRCNLWKEAEIELSRLSRGMEEVTGARGCALPISYAISRDGVCILESSCGNSLHLSAYALDTVSVLSSCYS